MGVDLDDLAAAVAVVVGLVVFGLLFWWLLLPLLLLVLDGILVALLVVAGVLARVVLRRPWQVSVCRGDEILRRVAVLGWRRALRGRDTIAAGLAAGASLDTALAAPSAGPYSA